MAQRRYTIVFYVAVFIAAMATYGVYRVLQAAKMSARVATKPVVVAAKDIPAGAALDKQSLEVKQWPAVAVPKDAMGSLDVAVGRVARVPVFTGEAIVPGRLARAGTSPGLEARIAPGMRAMSVPRRFWFRTLFRSARQWKTQKKIPIPSAIGLGLLLN